MRRGFCFSDGLCWKMCHLRTGWYMKGSLSEGTKCASQSLS